VRHARRRTDVQIEELAEDDFVQLAVLRQDERVVDARDEQDVVDPEARQIRKPR